MKKNTGLKYETLTQKVFSEIINQNSVETINVQHNVKLKGKTTTHQIDVYWEFKMGNVTYCTIVQAKDWTQPVPQGAMLTFKAILDDLPNQPRGIFVTKTSFQSGAKKVAKSNGILLYELRKPKQIDWEGKIKKMVISMHFFMPHSSNLKIIHDQEWVDKCLIGKSVKKPLKIQISGLENEVFLYDENNNPLTTIYDIINSFFPKQGLKKMEKTIKTKEFKTPTFVKTNNPILPILKIKQIETEIMISEHIEKMEINGEDLVGFILKNILDGEHITFDKELNIIK